MRLVMLLLILVFALCCLSAPAAQAELPPCLVELSQANSFQYEWLNQGTRSKLFQAYKQACRLPKCPSTKELDEASKNATPAGRLYLAFVVWEFDFSAGRQRFESLKKDQAILTVVPGCTRYQASLAAIASEFLEKGSYRDFPSSVFCKRPVK
ncbi:MAG: hypothetical protein Q8T09_16355 [Candidatus Melainabacteria bacterium]|nr:hypothetical protein [Candidatus Melainabacteria bacterium]